MSDTDSSATGRGSEFSAGLGPLPEPAHFARVGDCEYRDCWNAQQVRAYALAAIARHREALRDLANAADAVGVRYFDSDDPSDEVQAMQAATINAREVLRACEIVGAEVLPSAERGFTVSQLAEACISAEIPDSKFESLLLALRA